MKTFFGKIGTWFLKNFMKLGVAILILFPLIYISIDTIANTSPLFKVPLSLILLALVTVYVFNTFWVKGIKDKHQKWIDEWLRENKTENDLDVYNSKIREIRKSNIIVTILKSILPVVIVISLIFFFSALERTAATIVSQLTFASLFWLPALILMIIQPFMEHKLKEI